MSAPRLALLFGINNYPGSANDLNGCLNDVDNIEAKIKKHYPDFYVRKFKDAEVTRSRFKAEVDAAISVLQPGHVLLITYSGHGTQVVDRNREELDGYDEALFLFDGPLIDDDIHDSLSKIPEGATVVIAFDSCFSGTATRRFNGEVSRFHKMPGQKLRRKVRKALVSGVESPWVHFSGCREDQTSSDAFINGEYQGAFTYYWLKTLTPGTTYKQWIERLNTYLPGGDFEQEPMLEGRDLDRVIFC